MPDKIEVETAPASQEKPRTNFGLLAIIVALVISGPMLLFQMMHHLGASMSKSFMQNISDFVFDFGFLISVLSLALAIVGLFIRGRNRRFALVAIGLLILPWVLAIAFER